MTAGRPRRATLAAVERLKRIDHVGVVVDDLERVSRFLADVLGMELVRTLDSRERRLRANFFRCGDVDVELIELEDPEARASRLGENPARIDHIAIEVDDLAAAAGQLAERGIRMSTSAPARTATTVSFFSEPDSSAGVMLQFTQRLEEAPVGDLGAAR